MKVAVKGLINLIQTASLASSQASTVVVLSIPTLMTATSLQSQLHLSQQMSTQIEIETNEEPKGLYGLATALDDLNRLSQAQAQTSFKQTTGELYIFTVSEPLSPLVLSPPLAVPSNPPDQAILAKSQLMASIEAPQEQPGQASPIAPTFSPPRSQPLQNISRSLDKVSPRPQPSLKSQPVLPANTFPTISSPAPVIAKIELPRSPSSAAATAPNKTVITAPEPTPIPELGNPTLAPVTEDPLLELEPVTPTPTPSSLIEPNQFYRLKSSCDLNQVVSLSGASTNSGATISLAPEKEYDLSQEIYTLNDITLPNHYNIMFAHSEKMIDISDTNPGIAATQMTFNGNNSQALKFIAENDGTYRIQLASSQLFLSSDSAGIIEQQVEVDSCHQKFVLVPAADKLDLCPSFLQAAESPTPANLSLDQYRLGNFLYRWLKAGTAQAFLSRYNLNMGGWETFNGGGSSNNRQDLPSSTMVYCNP